jgi:signal transduction histidine kinase
MAKNPVNVLLVEDDEDDFVLARDLLAEVARTDYALQWVASYEEGLRQACDERFDVALIDYRLGERNGVEFIRRAIDAGCRVPLILLTGEGGHDVDLAAMEAGAADFLSKSELTGRTLERAIRYALQQRRSEDQRIELVRAQWARTQAESAKAVAEADNRAKDEFLATLSHELRTPLNAILGWSQLLAMGGLDPESMRDALEAIDRNARAQARLIDDLLDVTRIIRGKLQVQKMRFDLVHLVEGAVAALLPNAAAKKLNLNLKVDAKPLHVNGDEGRLRQVMTNLLNNAIKFTPQGGDIDVNVGRAPRDRVVPATVASGTTGPDGRLLVAVHDTGKGIAPEFLPHVFERFRQADSSTTREHGGLGLGLAIVRHLVEIHEGSVRAESPGVGRGATFTVELPEDRPGAMAARGQHFPGAAPGESRPSLAGLDILVVEDDDDARRLLARVLSQSGATVRVAASVAEAMRAIETRSPQVLLSDIGLPGEDGYALIRQLRSREQASGLACMPAIAITAYVRPEDRRRMLAAGFDAHVAKPVEPTELIELLAGLDVTRSSALGS